MRPGAIAVHYRPVLDLQCVRRAGGAALAEGTRWVEASVRRPAVDGRLLVPGEAGTPGLDDPTRVGAIEVAVRDAVRRRARSMTFPVAVGLSAAQLSRADIGPWLGALVDEAGGNREDLIVEVPAYDLDRARGAPARRGVADLCEHGFRVALEQVSPTAAGAARLSGLPARVIKVNPALVTAAPHDAAAATALEAQAAYARSAGLVGVATGIETRAQLDLMLELGFRVGQGPLLSRPLTAAEINVFCRPFTGEPAGIAAARRRLLAAD